MDEINPLYKSFKLAIGVLLSLIVAGYVVGVGMAGGLDNPDHPRSSEQLQMVLIKFAQNSQTADELLQQIKESNVEDEEWNALVAQDLQHQLGRRIERQRKIAARREDVPEDHRITFGKQLEQDLTEGLNSVFPDLVDIHIKSALMQEPDAYEILGGSKVPPGDLMEYVVKVAVEQGWLVMQAMHHQDLDTAYVLLMKEDREVFTAMLTREDVFENYPTLVYYSSVSDQYQDYEIPSFGSGSNAESEDVEDW